MMQRYHIMRMTHITSVRKIPINFNSQIIVDFGGFQQSRYSSALRKKSFFPFTCFLVCLLTEQSRIVLHTEFFQLNQKITKMCFESGEFHFQIKNSFNECNHLCFVTFGKLVTGRLDVWSRKNTRFDCPAAGEAESNSETVN